MLAFIEIQSDWVYRKQITAFCSSFVSCQVSLTGFCNTMLPYSIVVNIAKQSLILTAKLFSLKYKRKQEVFFYAQIWQIWSHQNPEFTLI